jgi:hypothetical protein
MKEFFKRKFFYIFGYLIAPRAEIWRFFLNIGIILAIEKSQKALILALLLFFNFAFWLQVSFSPSLQRTDQSVAATFQAFGGCPL